MSTPYDPQLWADALVELGYDSFSVEPDGSAWTGTSENKTTIPKKTITDKVAEIVARRESLATSAREKLAELGLTDEELTALIRSAI